MSVVIPAILLICLFIHLNNYEAMKKARSDNKDGSLPG